MVSGATVTFTAPASPNASGTFNGGTNTIQVQTGATGLATSPVFTANTVVGGPYNVTRAAGVASRRELLLQNLAGAPARITLTSATRQSATVNTPFTQFAVTVKDAGSNPVANAVVTFTAPAQTGPSGTFAAGAVENTATHQCAPARLPRRSSQPTPQRLRPQPITSWSRPLRAAPRRRASL